MNIPSDFTVVDMYVPKHRLPLNKVTYIISSAFGHFDLCVGDPSRNACDTYDAMPVHDRVAIYDERLEEIFKFDLLDEAGSHNDFVFISDPAVIDEIKQMIYFGGILDD